MKLTTICIDAGHSLHIDKKCDKQFDKKETKEWVLNDRIADMVEELLALYSCKVIRLDDTTGKTHIELNDRIKQANSINPDYIISIHHNAGICGGKGGGTTVYYGGSKSERKTQAKKLYDILVDHTNLIGDRKSPVVKTTSLAMVCKTKSPCLLIENGFMDSSTDVPIILTEKHARLTAYAILEFLVDLLGLKGKTTQYTVEVTCEGEEVATKCVKDLKTMGYIGKIKNKE